MCRKQEQKGTPIAKDDTAVPAKICQNSYAKLCLLSTFFLTLTLTNLPKSAAV